MRIAVISDIHANIYALEAVLKEIKKHSVDITVFLGDLVYAGIYPRECVSRLANMEQLYTIKGNADGLFDENNDHRTPNQAIDEQIYRIHGYVKGLMTQADITYIQAFPMENHISIENISIGFYHGSPLSYSDRIYEDFTEEEIMGKFIGKADSVAALGHTHHRMHIKTQKLELINPGAVGFSFDGDTRAGCGILTVEKHHIQYEQRNVAYPIHHYVHDIKNSDLPYKDDYIEQIQTGASNREYVCPRNKNIN